MTRTFFFFAHWYWFAPGGKYSLGWALLGLATVGLFAPSKIMSARIGGDPRWVMLASGILVAMVSIGPFVNEPIRMLWPDVPILIPNLYALLASFLPGLDSIRVVARLSAVLHVALCVIAGIGSAWLIRIVPSRAHVVATILIGLVILSTLIGLPHAESLEVGADPAEIRFFRKLEELGNEGPILELPVRAGMARTLTSPRQILLTAYHGRRTWTCFSSFHPDGRDKVKNLIDRLPARLAQKRLRRLGFTTLIIFVEYLP